MKIGDIVFIKKTEQYWDKPYTMKRHHVYDTKTIILRGKITDIRGKEFKAFLFDNNFEKDGEEFVFPKDSIINNYSGATGIWIKEQQLSNNAAHIHLT